MSDAAYDVDPRDFQTDAPNVAALTPRQGHGALVTPAGDVDAITKAFEAYQQVCGRLLDDNDHQSIGGKKFRKRSAWRKLAVAFGVSFEIRARDIHRDNDGRVVDAEFQVRAIAPNGRFADGWGACDVFERCCPPDCDKGGRHRHCPAATGGDCPAWTHFSHANHDIPATAETRAKNRAASDLFGMGEVSAEEITELESRHEHEQLLSELEALLDTAEGAGLEPDRAKAREYAGQSVDHAKHTIGKLRERLHEAVDGEPAAETAGPDGEEVDDATSPGKPDVGPEEGTEPPPSSPTAADASWREFAADLGVGEALLLARLRKEWPRNDMHRAPARTKDVDQLVTEDPQVAERVRGLLSELAAEADQ